MSRYSEYGNTPRVFDIDAVHLDADRDLPGMIHAVSVEEQAAGRLNSTVDELTGLGWGLETERMAQTASLAQVFADLDAHFVLPVSGDARAAFLRALRVNAVEQNDDSGAFDGPLELTLEASGNRLSKCKRVLGERDVHVRFVVPSQVVRQDKAQHGDGKCCKGRCRWKCAGV